MFALPSWLKSEVLILGVIVAVFWWLFTGYLDAKAEIKSLLSTQNVYRAAEQWRLVDQDKKNNEINQLKNELNVYVNELKGLKHAKKDVSDWAAGRLPADIIRLCGKGADCSDPATNPPDRRNVR